MALSANLFLRQSQSLVMTPQLMQSIQLLQMTHIELMQFISQEIERNPLLEMVADDGDLGGDSADPTDRPPPISADTHQTNDDAGAAPSLDSDWYEENDNASLNDRLDANFDTAFADEGSAMRPDAPELLSQWKSMPGNSGETGEGFDLDDFVAGQISLRDHLNQQIPFALNNDTDRLIAAILVDHLDEAGYLRADLGEVSSRLGRDRHAIEQVLETLQTLEPAGVFARTLSECLAIQLRQRDRYDPAMAGLVENLELLAKRDFNTLKKICGVDEEDLIDMLAEIRKLNPKPGSNFEHSATESVTPDIVVRPDPLGGWKVELNPDALPRVLVNQNYMAAVGRQGGSKDSGDQAFMSECLQSANWLTRSLDQRAKTIMKVAVEIVRQQSAFLEEGVDHLRPLNLKIVADAIKMHESTVSRVTTNKYMMTPRGLFELKYFFSVSIASAEGGDTHSAEAVRHRIRMMIAQESTDAVLSDDDIVHTLKSSGVDLARRTVAKYRESMNIPSSVQRRREKRAMAKVPAI
ncbi:RNA polymerase factor sigma-54 [Rhizobium sp. SL42]|uniref:RNA polymerase factor sigma-54 n=1 Tax=Rhizobium sp. SL42 TaxID=2806346 RepID=UPI001F008ADB|nr:RNA polymerase factor sigma-54 [Rhizobium sp. SL42]UJW75831.1 RNA polymerase factor sigma-54 [Rhizobium sp. SL42]